MSQPSPRNHGKTPTAEHRAIEPRTASRAQESQEQAGIDVGRRLARGWIGEGDVIRSIDVTCDNPKHKHPPYITRFVRVSNSPEWLERPPFPGRDIERLRALREQVGPEQAPPVRDKQEPGTSGPTFDFGEDFGQVPGRGSTGRAFVDGEPLDTLVELDAAEREAALGKAPAPTVTHSLQCPICTTNARLRAPVLDQVLDWFSAQGATSVTIQHLNLCAQRAARTNRRGKL